MRMRWRWSSIVKMAPSASSRAQVRSAPITRRPEFHGINIGHAKEHDARAGGIRLGEDDAKIEILGQNDRAGPTGVIENLPVLGGCQSEVTPVDTFEAVLGQKRSPLRREVHIHDDHLELAAVRPDDRARLDLGIDQLDFAFTDAPCGIGEGLVDVLRFQIGVKLQQARFGMPCSHHADDHTDGDSHAADAGLAAHDSGVVGNSIEGGHRRKLGVVSCAASVGTGGRPTVRWRSEPPFSSMVRRRVSMAAMVS